MFFTRKPRNQYRPDLGVLGSPRFLFTRFAFSLSCAVPNCVEFEEAIGNYALNEEGTGGNEEGENVAAFAGPEISERERNPAREEVEQDERHNQIAREMPRFPAHAALLERAKSPRDKDQRDDHRRHGKTEQ